LPGCGSVSVEHRELEASIKEADAGQTVDLAEALAELRRA
jgi:hypothetical protein